MSDYSETSWGYLRLCQKQQAVDKVVLPSVDVLMAFSSFEPRCLEICRAQLKEVDKVLVFRFQPFERDHNRAEHAQKLAERFRESASRVDVHLLGHSVDVATVTSQLRDHILPLYTENGGALRVAIDISSVPKTILLFMVALLLGEGLAKEVTCFYSEANYAPPVDNEGQRDYRFTDGPWSSVQVPYLEGIYHPGLPRHAIVSMGTEAASIEKFLSRYDPDSMTLVSPVPGSDPDLDQYAKRQAKVIKRNLGATNIVERSPFDAVACLESALDISVARMRTNDVMLFCLGPKPHALAFGICGIVNPEVPVICRTPGRYVERESKGSGTAWTYRIIDLSNPGAV